LVDPQFGFVCPLLPPSAGLTKAGKEILDFCKNGKGQMKWIEGSNRTQYGGREREREREKRCI